jgi:hypothetical protein
MAKPDEVRGGAAAGIAYSIDAADRIISVSDDWAPFALENGGAELHPDKVLGRPLWDFVTGFAVRDLYRMILRRVRSGFPVSYEIRCDAPHCRRTIRIHLEMSRDGHVHFRTELVRIEPRAAVALLDAGAPRGVEVLRICSWCKKVHIPPDAWVEVEEAVVRLGLFGASEVPQLSHGICRPCVDRVATALGA